MHTNSLCICIHTHTHTHTHTHLVCIPSTGITAFPIVFSTVPLLAFVVCVFVLCNRHYVIDTGSTGPRARRLAELGVSYLTPAVAQALAWVRSYLFFFFKTRTTRGVKGHIFCISAPWYAAGYGPVPGTARDSRPSLCFPFSHVCLATDSAAQKLPGSRPFFSSWTRLRARQGLVLRSISCPPCDGVWGTVSRTRNHVDGGLAEQGDRNSQKGHRPGQRGGENGGT